MRVTAEAKAATRQRILDAAEELFVAKGFDAATTRDLADAAGIASGTLFNYFATKESILAALAAEAAATAQEEFAAGDFEAESFEEDLFAFAAATLRKLKPLRKHLGGLLDTALSPLATAAGEAGESLRVAHLETVARLAQKHGLGELPGVGLQLYWTLFSGVLAFWSSDRSPKQEDTLALLDHSLTMFVDWLRKDDESPHAVGKASCSPLPRNGGEGRG